MSAQDSLYVGYTTQLPELRYPMDFDQGEFEKKHGHIFDSIAQFILSNPQAKFEIICHTDSRGTDSLNLNFSQRRANDWHYYLLKRGVPSKSVEAIGAGEQIPRKVWLLASTYFLRPPDDIAAQEFYLTPAYITPFKKDRKRFEYLHQLNRRSELHVVSIDNELPR